MSKGNKVRGGALTGRRAPALPSVKSHNAQGLHTPEGAINFKADGVALEGSEGAPSRS